MSNHFPEALQASTTLLVSDMQLALPSFDDNLLEVNLRSPSTVVSCTVTKIADGIAAR